MVDRNEALRLADYESCADCRHFKAWHHDGKCSGSTEGDRDDLVLDCGCVSFVSSEPH